MEGYLNYREITKTLRSFCNEAAQTSISEIVINRSGIFLTRQDKIFKDAIRTGIGDQLILLMIDPNPKSFFENVCKNLGKNQLIFHFSREI
jgi:hypothetical protein